MRRLALALGLVSAIALTSCAAGPHQLKRTVDDLDQKTYVNSPWLSGVLWFVPVFPLLHFFAAIGDFFVVDAYSFWIKDAWDGKGTGFKHFEVTPTDGQMRSLMLDDGKFLEIK
ncbi:MAG: hypothetical protein IT458_15695 [Planctomycetes bacterium]|nr:hypothetical protein [Planctomycetota bacterium]